MFLGEEGERVGREMREREGVRGGEGERRGLGHVTKQPGKGIKSISDSAE